MKMPHDKNKKLVEVGDTVIMQFRVESVLTDEEGTYNLNLRSIDSPDLYPDALTTFAKKVIITRKNRAVEKAPIPPRIVAEVADILKRDTDGFYATITAPSPKHLSGCYNGDDHVTPNGCITPPDPPEPPEGWEDEDGKA